VDHLFDMLKGKAFDIIRSLGTFEGYNPSINLFYEYLVDLPRKILWTTFFDHSFDFYKAYDKLKRALTFIDLILSVFSYIHFSEMHALMYHKLLQALTASKWSDLILNARRSWCT